MMVWFLLLNLKTLIFQHHKKLLDKCKINPRYDKVRAVIMSDIIIDFILLTISIFFITTSFILSLNVIPF